MAQNKKTLTGSAPSYNYLYGYEWLDIPADAGNVALTVTNFPLGTVQGWFYQDATGDRTLTVNGISIPVNPAPGTCTWWWLAFNGSDYLPDSNYTPAGGGAVQLATPTVSITSGTASPVVLDWPDVPGADAYPVQRAEDSGFSINLVTLGTPAVSTYSDATAQTDMTYYYRVKATGAGYTDSAYDTISVAVSSPDTARLIFNHNNWTSGTLSSYSLSSTGSASLSYPSGRMKITADASSSDMVDFWETAVGATNNRWWETKLRFVINNIGAYGNNARIILKLQSSIMVEGYVFDLVLSGTDAGRLYVLDGIGALGPSADALPLAAGDEAEFIAYDKFGQITLTVNKYSGGSIVDTISYTLEDRIFRYAGGANVNSMSAQYYYYFKAQGVDIDVISHSAYNYDGTGADLQVVGHSISAGCYQSVGAPAETYENAWWRQLAAAYPTKRIHGFHGGGLRTDHFVSGTTLTANGDRAVSRAPRNVTIDLLANDVFNATPVATTQANLQVLINKYIDAGTTGIFVLKCTPLNGYDVSAYNAMLANLTGVTAIVDTFTPLHDSGGNMLASVNCGDNVHPNYTGAGLLKTAVDSVVGAYL